MTRKSLFLAIFLSLTFFLSGSPARAQVDTPATTAQVDALQQTLITLLTQLIAQLQAQITELIAEQAKQSTQLGVVQSKVESVVTQTVPVVGVAEPLVSVGDLYCNPEDSAKGTVRIPITLTGSWQSARAEIYFPDHDTSNPDDYEVMKQGWSQNPTIFQTRDNAGTFPLKIYRNENLAYEGTVTISDCQ